LKFQNEPISLLQGRIDDFIYGLSVDNGPDTYSSRAKDPLDDKTVARVGKTDLIAIEDMVEKSSKVSTPTVPGALFSRMGQGSKKRKDFI